MVASNKYAAPKEEDATAIVVPTTTDTSLNPAHDREIDLRQMDEQDLNLLHKSDPFMYYSIPGVLQASLNLEDVDYSDIASLSQAGSHPSSSRPTRRSQEEAEDDADADANASKVSRRTRVSFECHPNVLLEGVMDELEQEFGDLLLDLDDIVSMLGSKSGSVSTMQ